MPLIEVSFCLWGACESIDIFEVVVASSFRGKCELDDERCVTGLDKLGGFD